jgi:hypothetical protein
MDLHLRRREYIPEKAGKFSEEPKRYLNIF